MTPRQSASASDGQRWKYLERTARAHFSGVAWRPQTDSFTTKRQYGTDWPEPPPVSYPYGLCVFSHKDSIECPSQ
ncbi:hypothetical protein EMIT0373P_20541 [Pseudomonas chlororaphis]